jgi:hypothetical protein
MTISVSINHDSEDASRAHLASQSTVDKEFEALAKEYLAMCSLGTGLAII